MWKSLKDNSDLVMYAVKTRRSKNIFLHAVKTFTAHSHEPIDKSLH